MSARDRIVLAAQPAGVSAARRFVRAMIEELGAAAEALLDDAVLLTSELVANAVLHAGGPIGVDVELEPGPPARIRIEVSDDSPISPSVRDYGSGASTGRGLALVARLASRWGVDPVEPNGKAVWAELVEGADHAEATPATTTMDLPVDAPPPAGERGTRFLGVPVDVYLRLQEQNDAVLRELELLAFTADQAGDLDPSPELIEVIERSRRYFNVTREGFRMEVLAASRRGDHRVDLVGLWDAAAVAPSADYVALFERAEELADRGELLIRPADAEVHRLRRWFVEEMSRQLLDREEPRPFAAQPPEDFAR